MAKTVTQQILIAADTRKFERSMQSTERTLNRFSNSLKKMTRESGKLTGIGKMPGGFIGRMIGTAASLATVYAAVRAVRELDEAVVQWRKTTGASVQEGMAYKQQVLGVGINSGLATEKIFEMSQAAFDSSKNMQFVTNDLAMLSQAYQAVGGDAKVFGSFVGKLNREFDLSGDAMKGFLDSLQRAGSTKAAESNLQQIIAAGGENLVEATKIFTRTTGVQGVQALKNTMALALVGGDAQTIGKAMRKVMSPKTQKYLQQKMGVNIFNKDGTMKDILAIIQEITVAAKKGGLNIQSELSGIFGGRISQGVMKVQQEIGNVNKLFTGGVGIGEAAGIAGASFGTATEKLYNAFKMMADSALAPAMQALADQVSKMSAQDMQALTAGLKAFGLGAADLVVWLAKFVGAIDELINNTQTSKNEIKNVVAPALQATGIPLTIAKLRQKGAPEDVAKAENLQKSLDYFSEKVTDVWAKGPGGREFSWFEKFLGLNDPRLVGYYPKKAKEAEQQALIDSLQLSVKTIINQDVTGAVTGTQTTAEASQRGRPPQPKEVKKD
jgi:hypothetical protein